MVLDIANKATGALFIVNTGAYPSYALLTVVF